MNEGFILRFQEPARPAPARPCPGQGDRPQERGSDGRDILAGTKTLTEATGEAADTDARARSRRAIPR